MVKKSDKMTQKSTALKRGSAYCVVIVVALATYRSVIGRNLLLRLPEQEAYRSTIGAYRRRLRRIV